MFAIGTVERDTGIGRDTLRIWERRYGFPSPERNEKGERVYSDDQIRRLQRFRRLLDQGRRPGKVLPLSDAAVDALADTLPEASLRPEDVDPAHEHLVALASSGDLKGLNAAILRSGFPTTPRSGTGVCDEPMGLERERVAAEEGACYCDTACRAEPPSDAKRYGHRAARHCCDAAPVAMPVRGDARPCALPRDRIEKMPYLVVAGAGAAGAWATGGAAGAACG